MSPRTRVTFAKRQKERARQEKQRATAQRKLERKLENQQATKGAETDESLNETAPTSDNSTAPQMDSH